MDLEAFLRERVRCAPGSCPPTMPGAPLGLPGSSVTFPTADGEGDNVLRGNVKDRVPTP